MASRATVVQNCIDGFPSFLRQHARAKQLDYWIEGKQSSFLGSEYEASGEGLFVPNPFQQTPEHIDLSSRAYTPWVGLVVETLAQTMFLDGVRMPGTQANLESWKAWQRNGWDAVQGRLYRSVLGHGIAFAKVFPGKDPITGVAMPKFTARSAKRMAAFYDDDDEDFPTFALDCDRYNDGNGDRGWTVQYIDEQDVHYLSCKGDGATDKDWTWISSERHGLGFPPVVRYTNLLDLDGKATGEIEPIIPVARRIDQDTYDRLIVQRYGAWKVRYITGLVKPTGVSAQEYEQGMMKFRTGDFLTFTSPDTKVGTLNETQLAGFVQASDKDLRDLAAVTQIPPHHMLGTTPQMQPESLASVNQSLMARSLERRTSIGQSHERLFRIAAVMQGNRQEAEAYDLQVRWRDTETRSLSQTADALGKIATQLQVPVEMLWERIEGWTDSDTERAKELVQNGVFDQLVANFQQAGMLGGQPGQPAPGQPAPKAVGA